MVTTSQSVSDESVVELTDVFETIRVTADLRAKSESDRTPLADRPASIPAWHALRRPVAYFLASRLIILIAGLLAKWRVPRLRLESAMTGWDGSWYTKIAQHGYPHGLFNEGDGSRWAFFPAYPATVRLAVDVTGLSYASAEILLSLVFGLTSVVAIWLAVRSVFGRTVADRSILLYVCFPASYVLSMAYTEGLFLTAAAACLYALSRRYWMTASAFAVLSSLTRSFGVVLIACVVVAAVPVVLGERKLRPLLAMAVAPLGFVGWLVYSWRLTGTPLAFLKAEQFWGYSHFMWFMTPVISLAHLLTSVHALADWQLVLASVALLFAIVGIDLLWRAKLRGTSIPGYWWVFTIGSVLGMMSPYVPTSVLRYSMAAFPLFAALAWKLRTGWTVALAGVMVVAQGALFTAVLVGTLHPHTTLMWP
jgi:mannosyltransferase PIG-V